MLVRYKNLSLAILLSGCSALSFAQPVLVKTEQNVEEYRLDNGLRIILAPNDKENKIFMNTVNLTGSLNDPKGKGGLAHLLEHLAFKGTKNVKGDEFQRRLDQYTLMTNASTDYYSTKYTNVIRPEKTGAIEAPDWQVHWLSQTIIGAKENADTFVSSLKAPTVTFGRLTGEYWLRLALKNGKLMAAVSENGTDWHEAGTVAWKANAATIGIVVASGIETRTTTVQFDSVKFGK